MGKIVCTLDKSLKKLGVTPNRVAVEAKIRPNTIYNMLENSASRYSSDTLASIIDALNVIAKEKGMKEDFDIESVILYKKR
ncbi:helix-turn-helix domain-containing protein [Bacillus infantis]|uniref:helix-turn-helix domain-containing protein n=1 Tax=Bacillus infantis TaxID=324767 RepID=UPI00321BB9B1